MKIFQSTLAAVFILTSFTGFAHASQKEKKPQSIKILLEKEVNEALVEVKGSYYIYDPYDNTRISNGFLGKRFIVRPTHAGIKWGQEFVDIHQIHIIPKSKSSSLLVNGIQYDGSVLVYKVGKKIHVINLVTIDDYLKATLTNKFPLPLEKEVMAALAIAERTTAYYHANKNQKAFWHIDSRESKYNGCALVIDNSSIASAVDATTNMVMLNSNEGLNSPFIACWNEHSGGKTIPFHIIFRKDSQAPKAGVKSPHASLDRVESKWSYSMAKEKLAQLLNLASISKVELYLDQDSQKTYGFKVLDSSSKSHDFDFLTFQDIIGGDNLLSNDLAIEQKGANIVFSGYGKGHGVGMCLYTASAMAQNGEMALRILTKFFPETFLVNLTAVQNMEKNIADSSKEKARLPRL
jgi:stage II sporulation protein D